MPVPHRPFPDRCDELVRPVVKTTVTSPLKRVMQVRVLPREFVPAWSKTEGHLVFRCRLFPGQGLQAMDESKLIEITRPGGDQSLCRTCYWAHAQKGFRESEEAIFCMFGPLRKVTFRVRDCTDYMNRTLPTRAQMEKIALIIPTEPARKKLGFSGLGFSNGSEEED